MVQSHECERPTGGVSVVSVTRREHLCCAVLATRTLQHNRANCYEQKQLLQATPTLNFTTPAPSMLSTLTSCHSPARRGEGYELTKRIVPCHVIMPSTYTWRKTFWTSTTIGDCQPVHARTTTCVCVQSWFGARAHRLTGLNPGH